MLSLAYLALLVVGGGYVLFSMFFGGGDDAGAEVGSEVHVGYGVEGGGEGSATASASSGSFHFPFFSPLAVATLLGSTGAWGLIGRHGLGFSANLSLVAALAAALLTTYATTYVSWRLVQGSRASSLLRTSEMAGAEGEVSVPIPEQGIGEVVVLVAGQRFNSSARSASGGPLARGSRVVVEGLVGTHLVVRAKES